MFNIPLAIQRN